MAIIETDTTLTTLREQVDGVVLAPGDPGWDTATLAFNTAFTQEPSLVAIPANVRDVQTLVVHARENGLQVAPQRTGHNAEPLGSMDDVLLLRTDALRGVEIDVDRRVARVLSGAKWGDLVPRASELGLAALHGSTPDVSVVGYALGGGVGWYARKLGLATNSVVAIELVTADGVLRRVDHENEPELFWALRGGGGNFGVVTAIEVQLFELAEVYAGVLFFPWERSTEVLQAWLEWTRTVPDEVTSVGRILQFPPLPEIPEPLRGGRFVVVEAVVLGTESEGAELMAPLRALGPTLDTFAMVPPAGIAELHMDPPDPVPYTGEGQMLGELTPAAIDAFVAAAGPGSGSPLQAGRWRSRKRARARLRVPQPGSGRTPAGSRFRWLPQLHSTHRHCRVGCRVGPDHFGSSPQSRRRPDCRCARRAKWQRAHRATIAGESRAATAHRGS